MAKEILSQPKAPKDPVKRRSCLYVMAESIIEATPRAGGKPSQEIYLDNKRLKSKVQLSSGFDNEDILGLLNNSADFRKLVHSIGVTVNSNENPDKEVLFIIHNYGKTNKYETGSVMCKTCTMDGTEVILELNDYPAKEEDDEVGRMAFEFDNPGEIATATVRLYLNDGFDVPEISLETPVEFDSPAYREMISKSLMNKGNNYRLKAAIEKAERGEDVTIAYIGGSITQGAGAKPINTECYAYQSYLKIKERIGTNGGENIHFVKAGVGGTPSELGMIRYDRDILRDGTVTPDILVIEFAVNDAGDETMGACFESLCLKALSEENKPAVILLFSVFLDDYNLQDRLAPIGFQYNLPMVSVKNAVVDQFRLTKDHGNVISRKQYFYDVYHPTNDGHCIMADCIVHLIDEVLKDERETEDINLDLTPVIGNDFTNVHLIDRKDNTHIAVITEGGFTQTDTELQSVEMDVNLIPTPQFPHNWMRTSQSGNESFKMKIKSKNLLIVFKDTGSSEFGKAEAYVDGKLIRVLDPHENNWTHCNPAILFREQETGEHEIEIRMAEGDEHKSFTILGFGYTL